MQKATRLGTAGLVMDHRGDEHIVDVICGGRRIRTVHEVGITRREGQVIKGLPTEGDACGLGQIITRSLEVL